MKKIKYEAKRSSLEIADSTIPMKNKIRESILLLLVQAKRRRRRRRRTVHP